jgi:predicted amidohydrolase
VGVTLQILNVIDLGKESIDPCKIALCQISCPSESEVTKNYRFIKEIAQFQEKRILKCLESLEESIRFVVFPEFSIPEKTLPKLINVAREKNIYIIGGLEYDSWLKNQCIIVTPFGKCYRSAKINRSKYDHQEMKCGEFINCFINSGFGDFAVLVCYDYTSQNVIQELSGKIDILFVVENNRDVEAFSQKAINDCWTSYCFIVICNNAEHGCSGVYGPLDSEIKQRIRLEIQKGENCENLELNIMRLKEAIEKKTGLKFENGSRFKTIPADFLRKKLSASNPQLEYTLLDWPQPFDQDCIIILGSSIKRAIHQLTGHVTTFEGIKESYPKFYDNLKPYLPAYNKYFIARTSDAILLPQLTARLLFSPYARTKIPPTVYLDDLVIHGDEQIDPLLKKHNIISIGTSEVNKVSEKINEELRIDKRVYTASSADGLRPHTIFDESIGRELDTVEAPDAGIIGLTRNPFNPDKLALLCGGIHGVGTSAALKFLAENDGTTFRGHRYGLTVFAISPSGVPRGQGLIEKVETIEERKLRR